MKIAKKEYVIQEKTARALEDLSYSRVAGWHFIAKPIKERLITQQNMKQHYGLANYEKNGCMVIDLNDHADLMAMVDRFDSLLRNKENKRKLKKTMGPIFNTIVVDDHRTRLAAELKKAYPKKKDPRARLDHGRNQWLLQDNAATQSVFHVEIHRLAFSIGQAIEAIISAALAPDEPAAKTSIALTLLETLPPAEELVDGKKVKIPVSYQLLHRDMFEVEGQKRKRTASIGLLALQHVSDLRVQVGSHVGKVPRSDCSLFRLKKGQLFVGHPYLIHSGASATEWNLRLHFYMGLDNLDEQLQTDIPDAIAVPDMNAKMNILRMKREASQEKKKSAKRLRLDNINNNIA